MTLKPALLEIPSTQAAKYMLLETWKWFVRVESASRRGTASGGARMTEEFTAEELGPDDTEGDPKSDGYRVWPRGASAASVDSPSTSVVNRFLPETRRERPLAALPFA